MEKERFWGIMAFGLIILMLGIMGFYIFMKNFLTAEVEDQFLVHLRNGTLFGIVLSIGFIMVAVGLFLRKQWARYFSMLAAGLFSGYFFKYTADIYALSRKGELGPDQILNYILLIPLFVCSVLAISYFLHPSVREHFREWKEALK